MNTPLLHASSLKKQYNGKLAVDGVSFDVLPGEILGLLGPNGAGKSTTLGMLYGVVTPDDGAVTLCGHNLLGDGKRARSNLGVVPQEDSLDSDLPVKSSLLSFANYYGIPRHAASSRIDELLQKFGLNEYANRNIETLSGGLKRRLALARALISKPKVIFLDEPTTGLDPDARQDFWRQILAIRAEGCAILLTTHYMDEAERLCDRIILLQDGKQIDSGPPADLILRHVGEEVLEFSGLEAHELEELARRHNTWCRRFAEGYLIGLPQEQLWQETVKLLAERQGSLRVTRRKGTLEDVFLSITGSRLT